MPTSESHYHFLLFFWENKRIQSFNLVTSNNFLHLFSFHDYNLKWVRTPVCKKNSRADYFQV